MTKSQKLIEYIRGKDGVYRLSEAALVVYGDTSRASIARCRSLTHTLVAAGSLRYVGTIVFMKDESVAQLMEVV